MSEASKHTPGPWRIGKNYGAVVADHPVPGIRGSDHFEAYGGHLVGESIAPQNLQLIAAAPELLAALQWREQFEPREGEDANERFERIAAVFQRETGHLRPGKDCVIEPPEVRQAAWDAWLAAGRARVRSVIAKASTEAP